MSIQNVISNKMGVRLIGLRVLNRLHILFQKIYRFVYKNDLKVYFPYRDILGTHPFFCRYYTHPPVAFCIRSDAKLAHWLNMPEDKLYKGPFVIEPNDHPLSATGFSEPHSVIGNVDLASEIYLSKNCKKILIQGDRQLSLIRRYLPEEIIKKTEFVSLGAIAKRVNFNDRRLHQKPPIFLCLASEYKRKAVDLLIEAWLASKARKRSQLILACPNVPYDIEKIFSGCNIQLIRKAPLSEGEKSRLYRMAQVVIAPLHTDGGSNIIEAFEYGLPVITMRSQRSFVNKSTGWEIDVPFYFYDDGYGHRWRTWEQFWKVLDDAKLNNEFDLTIKGMTGTIDEIAFNSEVLFDMSIAAHNLAKGELSLENRNKKLALLYIEALRNR